MFGDIFVYLFFIILFFINHDHNYNCFNCNYSHVYMG